MGSRGVSENVSSALTHVPRRKAAVTAAIVAAFALIVVLKLAGGATAAEPSVATASRDDLVLSVTGIGRIVEANASGLGRLDCRSSGSSSSLLVDLRRLGGSVVGESRRSLPTREQAGWRGTSSSPARTSGPVSRLRGSTTGRRPPRRSRRLRATSRSRTSSCGRSAPAIRSGASRRRLKSWRPASSRSSPRSSGSRGYSPARVRPTSQRRSSTCVARRPTSRPFDAARPAERAAAIAVAERNVKLAKERLEAVLARSGGRRHRRGGVAPRRGGARHV